MTKSFLSILLIPAFVLAFAPAQAEELLPVQEQYLKELIHQANTLELSEKRYWHLLLHYRKNIWGGHTSEADGPGFFLSQDGRKNPGAELESTLSRFFSEERVGTSKQQGQCAYPARYRWLDDYLDFDASRMPAQDCSRFKRWMKNLDPESITLIFPSAYMNNPASLFGHTLLRIDQKDQTDQTRLLAYVINYAAAVTSDNGFTFALYGITGVFQGYFSIIPYYIKVREYSDMENRDIWEYRLNFDHSQIERMLMHAWELGNTYFDYYFFKENCSYHLLSLLEVANPELHLTDRFYGWTIPTDTVRIITEQPGLVIEKTYRPSRSTKIRRKRETLSRAENRLLLELVEDPSAIRSTGYQDLSRDRQAFVLDTAYDYLRFEGASGQKKKGLLASKQQSLLKARSELRVPSEPLNIKPFTESPEEGHRSFRVGLGGGWQGNDSFEELSLRAAYHDLLDSQESFISGSQIEGLNLQLRYKNEENDIRLHSLTLVNIISLTPMDAMFQKPSWKLNFGWDTVPTQDCSGCRILKMNGGVGAAYQTHLVDQELYYAMAELEAEYASSFDKRHRMGGGGTAGLLIDLVTRWRIHLYTTYLSFPIGDQSFDFRKSIHQRLTLSKNIALRLELDRRNHQTHWLLRLDHYL